MIEDEAKVLRDAQLAEEARLAQLALEKLAQEKREKQKHHKKNVSISQKPKAATIA